MKIVNGGFDKDYSSEVIDGSLEIIKNRLTSLEGCPNSISGDFNCQENQLTNLKGSPQSVGGGFYCHSNQLTSLKGAPQTIGVEILIVAIMI